MASIPYTTTTRAAQWMMLRRLVQSRDSSTRHTVVNCRSIIGRGSYIQQQRWMSSTSKTETTVKEEDDDHVIGFLGLGNMGTPMAINLAKTRKVIAYDPNADALSKAKDEGGILTVDSVHDVGSEASIIVTMLPSCEIVNMAMTTLLEACGDKRNDDDNQTSKKTLFVDCSTVSPTTSRYWHEMVQAQGHDMVDAPVSGGVKGAQNATLTFMVGNSCSEETMTSTVTPLLELMGQRIVRCGGPGTGSSAKLCNNLALAAQMVGICEAMNLGEALGVDPIVLANVMNTSTAKSWSCEVNNPHPTVAQQTGSPASNNYQGGFGTKLMLKDLGLAVAAGQEARVALPIGTATKELYQLADLHDLGNKDFGVILKFLKGKDKK